jgi:hypothetical protein
LINRRKPRNGLKVVRKVVRNVNLSVNPSNQEFKTTDQTWDRRFFVVFKRTLA